MFFYFFTGRILILPDCRYEVIQKACDDGENIEKYQILLDEWQDKKADFVDNSGEGGIINKYKGKGLPIVSNKEISKDTTKKVEKAIKRIMRDFPTLKHYSEAVSFGEVAGGGHAVNNYDPKIGLNNIVLNLDSFLNIEGLLRRLDYDYA